MRKKEDGWALLPYYPPAIIMIIITTKVHESLHKPYDISYCDEAQSTISRSKGRSLCNTV